MNRIEITRSIVGACHMQVCAEADVTDEEILRECNYRNPSGTKNGWSRVIRDDPEPGSFWAPAEGKTLTPVPCANHPGRMHLLVAC